MKIPQDKTFTPAPAGTHRAICIEFIDLGTQEVSFQGKASKKHQVRIRWELCDEQMQDGRPYTISKKYTWSMSSKATLRKHLESWRGRPFSDEDFGTFDTKNLLGKPCLLTIGHEESNGETYAAILAVSPLAKGMDRPGDPVNPAIYFALEYTPFNNGGREALQHMHEKLREVIMRSPEYRQLASGSEPERGQEMADDEIPF